MRLRKLTVAGAMIALAGPALLGCSSSSGSGSSGAGTTITYWATNQGATLQQDQEVLAPQMAKFTQETGSRSTCRFFLGPTMTPRSWRRLQVAKGPMS